MITAPVFRFEEAKHEYFLNDQRIPGTTELLDKGGHLKGKIYFTDAHRRRGQAVHAMCAQIDLGEITRPPVDAAYRGYVLGWLDFLNQPTLKPIWHRIEEAEVEPTLRFGTRPDRVGIVLGRHSVVEIKSGAKMAHHPLQTAIQAIGIAWRDHLPANRIQRVCVYLKENGKHNVDVHEDNRDFDEARSLISRFC